MRIRTPAGIEVPFTAVARAAYGRGYSAIQRTDGKRTVHVTADIDETRGNANRVLARLSETALPEIMTDHPGVTYSLEGEQREQQESMAGLYKGFLLSLLMIYALMAIPFKSYVQPFVVMSAIPFGLVGAVVGHAAMGLDLSVMSVLGMVALAGVTVNDSLVLVDYVNRRREGGAALLEAVREAGAARFRPILLTSMTTFVGLLPMLTETSLQARFLIPMAASLAFGVLFSTVITLVLVPSSYLILEDVRGVVNRLTRGRVGRNDVAMRGESVPRPEGVC
jgi:multidrug efflux pump subunit AcrB